MPETLIKAGQIEAIWAERDGDLWNDPERRAELVAKQDVELSEFLENTRLGVSVEVSYIGDQLNIDEQRQAITEHMEYMMKKHGMESIGYKEIVGNAGFDETSWARPVETRKELLATQVGILGEAVVSVAQRNGWGVEDIDEVYVGGSALMSPFVAERLRDGHGLREDVEVHTTIGACNTTAYNFDRAVGDQRLISAFNARERERRTVFVSCETMMALRIPFEDWSGCTDWTMFAYFSDNVGSMAVDLGRVERIAEVTMDVPDEKSYLAAIQTVPVDSFGGNPTRDGGIIWEGNSTTVVELPPMPEEFSKQALYLSPRAGVFFVNMVKKIAPEYKARVEAVGESLANMSAFLTHRAGQRVFEHKKRYLTSEAGGIGIPEHLIGEWSAKYGNSPVNTFFHQAVNKLRDVRPGSTVGTGFYGAGGTATWGLYRFS